MAFASQLEFLVRLEALREDLALDEEHSAILQNKYSLNQRQLRELDNAASSSSQWLWLGSAAFVQLSPILLKTHLEQEQARLAEEIDKLERAITRKGKELERLEFDYNECVQMIRLAAATGIDS